MYACCSAMAAVQMRLKNFFMNPICCTILYPKFVVTGMERG